MDPLSLLFGGSTTKYKGGYNPNKEIWEGYRKPTLDALREYFGGDMPKPRNFNITMDGQTFGRYHPDYLTDMSHLFQAQDWGPIESPHPETISRPGLLSLLGLGLGLFK